MTWQVRSNADSIAVFTLLECVTEIASDLENFVQIARDDTPSGVLMIAKARQISLALRKVLLDGSGSLLKRCIANPDFHPLKAPMQSAATLSRTETFAEQSLVISFADGSSQDITIPTFRHLLSIHPLYGITHEVEGRSVLTSPFDTATRPIRFSRWMNSRVLKVNAMEFDVESLLRLLAVNEGAHTNERLPFLGPVLPDEDNIARYSAIDGIKFGVFSYMHFFSIFTGLYLVHKIRNVLDNLMIANSDSRLDEMRRLISLYPREFPDYMYAPVSTAYNPLFVLGKEGKLVGDYTHDILTTMRIP